jgi:hypothetical protein
MFGKRLFAPLANATYRPLELWVASSLRELPELVSDKLLETSLYCPKVVCELKKTVKEASKSKSFFLSILFSLRVAKDFCQASLGFKPSQ